MMATAWKNVLAVGALAGGVFAAVMGPAEAAEVDVDIVVDEPETSLADAADRVAEAAQREVDEVNLRLPLVDLVDFRGVDDEFIELRLFDIPLLRGETTEIDVDGNESQAIFADVPIFRLSKVHAEEDARAFSFLEVLGLRTLAGSGNDEAETYKFAVLDSPIVSLAEVSEVKDRDSWKVLDTFMGPTASVQRRVDDNWRTQLFDFGLFQLFDSRRDGDLRKMHVFDFTVFETYDYERAGEDLEINFANGPAFHFFRKQADEDYQKTDILSLPLKTLLYRNESEDNGDYHRRFLRLPLLGSMVEDVNTADERKTKVLWFMTFNREKE